MEEPPVFQCPECGLHYKDMKLAKDCEAFCSQNKACNLDIARHSIEVQDNQ